MKRSIPVLLFILCAVSFYTCSDDPVLNNPFGGGNSIPTITSNHSIDGSTIIVSWGGNELALEFNYRYKFITDAWPEDSWLEVWSSENGISIPLLDEGNYKFEIKSRLEEGFESTLSSFEFEINAVTGPALRFYPLYKEVSASSQFTMDIYVEDVADLTGAEIAFTYDKDFVSFNSAVAGAKLITATNNILIDEESQAGSVVLTLATYEDNGIGIAGSGSLVQLSFTALTSTSSYIELEISTSSFYIKNSNEQAEIENSFESLHNARLIIE